MKRKAPGTKTIERRRNYASEDPSAAYVERRERLLAAAAEVFQAKGLERTSINDIAERLGMDRAALYYYYRSKEDIFLALVHKTVQRITVLAEEIAKAGGSSTLRVRSLVQTVLEIFESTYPTIHIYIREDLRRLLAKSEASAEIEVLARRYETAVAKIIKEGIASGELRPELDVKLVQLVMLGAVNWSHRWFVPGGRLSGAEIGRSFADMLLHGVATSKKPALTKKSKPAKKR